MCIEAACRQRRAAEPGLLEDPLVHGPCAVKEVNLGVRLPRPDLFGDRQQRIDVPARAAACEEKRNVAHIGLLACPSARVRSVPATGHVIALPGDTCRTSI